MLKFIMRLDDACPNMNKDNWRRVEKILDKYNVKPIVGIIPDNKFQEVIDKYGTIDGFWENYALEWQNKNWIIAQHGLHHPLTDTIRTEYIGKSYDVQLNMLKDGYAILQSHGIKPTCFFAPAHRFDDNTVLACAELKYFDFISDGYAYYPYTYKGMMFFPSVFDTPHIISKNGIYTFIYHPNNMQEKDFEYMDKFIGEHRENFDVNIDEIIEQYKNRKRNARDKLLDTAIHTYRKIRNFKRKITPPCK